MDDFYQQQFLTSLVGNVTDTEEKKEETVAPKKKSRIDEMILGVTKDEMKRVGLGDAEIVRRQYMSHIKDATLTIRPDGVTFNNSCIAKMVDTYYIQFFIDRGRKLLIIRACEENDKDGQRWCNEKDGVRKSRKITGRPFCTRVYNMMGWSKGYYYRILGTPALQEDDEDELLFVFELEEFDRFPLTAKGRKAAGVTDEELDQEELQKLNEEERARAEQALAEGKKLPKPKRLSRHPEEWGNDSFGPKVSEHQSRIVLPRIDEIEASTAEEFRGQPTQK